MCSPISHHALTFLRAHYRALLQHAHRACFLAVLITLSPLSLSAAQAADFNVNSILTGKSDKTQSWSAYLSSNLTSWEQQWSNDVLTDYEKRPWKDTNPSIINTWVKDITIPDQLGGPVYSITNPSTPNITWNNVIFTESKSANYAPLALISYYQQTDLTINNTLFYNNKTNNPKEGNPSSIIYTYNFNITIQDSAFINNKIAKNTDAGVIQNNSNSASNTAITIKAVDSNVIFAENTFTNNSEAPAISNSNGLTLQAGNGRSIVFDDPIVNNMNITVNNEAGNDGTVVFGSGLETMMSLNQVTVGRGRLEVQDSKTQTNDFSHTIATLSLDQPATLALEKEVALKVDTLTHKGNVDLQHGSTLTVTNAWEPAENAQITVTGNATVKADTVAFPNAVTISFAHTQDRDPDEAMLTLDANTQQEINLDQVTVVADVPIEQALKSQDGVILIGPADNEVLTGDPKFHNNNMFELNYDPATGNFTLEAISTTDPDTPGIEDPTVPEPPEQETPSQPETPEPEVPLTPEEQQQAAIETFTERLGTLGATGQQQAVFSRMMAAYGTAEDSPYYEDFDQLWRYLQLAPVPEMLGALSALTPDYSALVLTQERALNEDVTDAVFHQPDAQPLGAHSALWLKASTVSGEHEGASAFELDRNSVALGLSTKLPPSWDLRAGFALSDFDGNTSSRDLEGDAYRIFLGSTYQVPVGPGTLELGGVVQAGQSSYEESLGHPALGQHRTDYDVTTVGAALRAGYTVETERGAISPELKLSYLHADSDGLSAPLGQEVSDATANLVTVQAGVYFKAHLLTTPNTKLTLTGGLHAAYDLAAEGLERTVTLADGSGYQLAGMEPDDFRLLPQLSLELNLYDSLELEAGFRRSQGDDYSENLWQARAQYCF